MHFPGSFFRKKWHVLCDEFSWAGWQHENAVRIRGIDADPALWEKIISNPPQTDFLLVESVWEDFHKSYRTTELIKLIRAFKKSGVRVFFWNKEDPAHFETYLKAALECDAVLTTASEKCAGYRAAGFKGPIEVLTFPVQPRIHKRYGSKEKHKQVFFAGSPWFHHPERLAAYHYFLFPALELGCVDLYARKSSSTSRASWPEECQKHILGELPYPDMLRESSKYALGLSLSCCPRSETMYPRRIVEIPMSGTLVISDTNRAVQKLFPEIPQVSCAEETRKVLSYFLKNSREREARLESLRRTILKKHTYAQALQQIRTLLP